MYGAGANTEPDRLRRERERRFKFHYTGLFADTLTEIRCSALTDIHSTINSPHLSPMTPMLGRRGDVGG